jgi:hypothetical protein
MPTDAPFCFFLLKPIHHRATQIEEFGIFANKEFFLGVLSVSVVSFLLDQ